MDVDEPKKLLKRRLKLNLHAVSVKVNVGIHRLNVHLIRIPGELVALRVIPAGVLDQRLLHEFENRLVILRVDHDRKRFNPAVVADLDRAEGRQVLPELAQIFAVVVLKDENRISGVLLHSVHVVGKHQVDSVLKRPASADQRNLLLVVLACLDVGN